MSVKERIKKFIEFKGISQRHFESESGLSNGYVNNIATSISHKKLEGISNAFPELNTSWLILGEGEMLRTKEDLGYEPEIEAMMPEGSVRRLMQFVFRRKNVLESISDVKKGVSLYRGLFAKRKESVGHVFSTVFEQFPELNPDWILTGKGEMLIDNSVNAETDSTDGTDDIDNELNIIKQDGCTEFKQLGDDRYMVICPLVVGHDQGPYQININNSEYLNNLPKHAVVFDRLRLGVYRSFAVIDDQPNFMTTTFSENIKVGCIVTGRRVEKKLWQNEAYLATLGGVVVVKSNMVVVSTDRKIQKKELPGGPELDIKDALELFEIEAISHYKK